VARRPDVKAVPGRGRLLPWIWDFSINRFPLLVVASLLPACASAPEVSPAVVAGCHAITAATWVEGDTTLDLLFPFFFELDTTALPGASGRVVRLPRNDLNRQGGAWSWRVSADTVLVDAVSMDGAWRLRTRPHGAEWTGTLVAERQIPIARWRVEGRWVPCPAAWRH
jgi:hypothetical protein